MKRNKWDIGLVYFLLFAAASVLLGATIQIIYDIIKIK